MDYELRPFWNRLFKFNWKFGLFLVLIICIPRFILVLDANSSGNYKYIGLIMFISALAPFIFLNRDGLKKIGICKPVNLHGLLFAFAAGLLASFFLYYIGDLLYGNSLENWYKYIARSYSIPTGINTHDKAIFFMIMAITGMSFSPIGEELFFRGIVHSGFAKSMGERKASIVDSSAFAATHISHFGLVFIGSQWHFFTFAAIIWVFSMFLLSLLFITFKRYCASIIAAIICHSAFNLGMIYCIFYLP